MCLIRLVLCACVYTCTYTYMHMYTYTASFSWDVLNPKGHNGQVEISDSAMSCKCMTASAEPPSSKLQQLEHPTSGQVQATQQTRIAHLTYALLHPQRLNYTDIFIINHLRVPFLSHARQVFAHSLKQQLT